MRKSKPSLLSPEDQHALAAYFAMFYLSAEKQKRRPGEKEIGRVVMATFGLVAKKGKYRLTARGKRAVALARTEI
jgi:hypothetical protein